MVTLLSTLKVKPKIQSCGENDNMAIVASELHWVPETLYNASVSCIVVNFKKYRRELPQLPRNVQFDVYYKVKLLLILR